MLTIERLKLGDQFYLFLLFSGILSLLELSDEADLSQGGGAVPLILIPC